MSDESPRSDGEEQRKAQAEAEAMAAELGQALARSQSVVDQLAARRLRYLEGGIGIAIFLGFVGRWVQAELLSLGKAPAAPPPSGVNALLEAPAPQLVLGVAVLLGVAALVGLVVAGTRVARAEGLGRWWRARAERLRDGPLLAYFLVAFGAYFCAQAATLFLMPTATLVVLAPAPERVKLPLMGGLALEAGGKLDVPGLPKDRLRVVPAGDMTGAPARLIDVPRVRGGREAPGAPPGGAPVRVDGVVFTDASMLLKDGAVLEVGPLRARVEAVGPDGRRDRLGLATLGQLVGLLAILLGAHLGGGGDAIARLGLVRAGLAQEVKRGVIAGLALLPVYALVLFTWQEVARRGGASLQSHPLIEELARNGAAGLWLIIALQAAVVAPLAEELLFRGLLLPGYARVIGPLGGLVASSLVFGAIHPGFQSLLPIALVGATCAAVTATSPHRSLVGAIVTHMLFNGVQLAAMFVALSTRP